jgi:hypothetical protein
MKLSPSSSNGVWVRQIHRSDGEPIDTVTSVSAFIYLASDGTRAPLANSSISLVAVDDIPEQYRGMFPATVALTSGTDYVVRVTVVADGLTRVRDTPSITATFE